MDKVYAFDKLTGLGTSFGEIQSEFNMSFVIDGTKDSSKIVVHSWNGTEIEPYTIIYHANTQTWWIVSHDKVERYQNEQSFLYIHNLTLLGAIELLNARDLTDCGFNQDAYTVEAFINRLFSLSNFEYSIYHHMDANFMSQTVKYIKTFENYTLLSALREFLDGYNMVAKLGFTTTYDYTNDTYNINRADLYVLSKTGDYTLVYDLDDFNDTRETKTIDKNSFGTTVVSNAENVISSESKTFPSVGGVMLSSNENEVTYNNALIRLPSNVFKMNWLKILHGLTITLEGVYNGNTYGPESFVYTPFVSKNKLKERALNIFETLSFPTEIITDFENKLDAIAEQLNLAGTITLYNGNKLVPYFGSNNDSNGQVIIEKGDSVPYLAELYDRRTASNQKLTLIDKNNQNILPIEYQGIVWERGSNIVSNFTMFRTGVGIGFELRNFLSTDLRLDDNQFSAYSSPVVSGFSFQIDARLGSGQLLQIKSSNFIVNYIPMSDLKIKVDNTREKIDIQLYNQNGKLTDNVALSKLINSYAKEISSDTITRYKQYYSFNDVPQIGSIVKNGNIDNVISNVSLDFMQNENETYYIEAEITMSKYVSTKSMLTNPNTNIRDYGIQQNFNVKRKQLYRDYYELGYEFFDDSNSEDPYLSLDNIFVFNSEPNILPNYIGVMRLRYNSDVQGSRYWYYQLETTRYQLDKILYVVLDFNDNNIIGYGSQNIWCGFDVTRIFRNMTDTVNTPVSYVDDNGQFAGIDLLLCSNEQITSIYDEYQEVNGGNTWDGTLYNYSIFIPNEIYAKAIAHHQIRIYDNMYNKDALEVPVFEYACQINDSEDVLIGDNILTQRNGFIYFYSYITGQHLTQNNAIDSNQLTAITSPLGWQLNNAVAFNLQHEGGLNYSLELAFYDYSRYDVANKTWSLGNRQTTPQNTYIAVFRHAYNLATTEEIIDLVLIAKNVPKNAIISNTLYLAINHYKLK